MFKLNSNNININKIVMSIFVLRTHRRFFRSATQPTMMCDAERVFSAGLNRAAAEQMALSCAAFRADPTKILYKEQIAREP